MKDIRSDAGNATVLYTIVRSAGILVAALALGGCLTGSGGGWSDDGTARVGTTGSGGDTGSNGVDVDITSPTEATSIDTVDESISLAGSASAAGGVAQVIWNNSQGGNGTASGTESWKTGAIDLELGDNRITVTARDADGKTSSSTVVVNRESKQKGSATLSWTAPTRRVDGTPLKNLAGYTIHYGRMSGVYDYTVEIDNPGVLTYVVENLVPGKWFFTLTAFDKKGLESEHSGEVTRKIS